MEVIRQAILDTFGHLRPAGNQLPETRSIELGARARSGVDFEVTRVLLDYRGEGFLTDYQFQGREYRTFWPLAQSA
jgi:hypothetical protein